MKLTDALKDLETVAEQRDREAERERLAEERRLRRIAERDERRIARDRAAREAAAAAEEERRARLAEYARERYKDKRLQRAETVLDESTGIVMTIAQKRWIDSARAHYVAVDVHEARYGGGMVAVCERNPRAQGGAGKQIIVRLAKSGTRHKYDTVEEALNLRVDLLKKKRLASGRLRKVEEGEIPLALPQDGFRYHNVHAGFDPGMRPLTLGYQWGDDAVRDPADFIPERVAGRQLLDTLTGRDRLVLKLRFGGVTLDAVGEHLGITRERVRQIESQALQALRGKMNVAVRTPSRKDHAPEPVFRPSAYTLTPEQREVVAKLLAKHVSVSRIAEAAGIPTRSMHRVIERYGLKTLAPRLPLATTQKSLLAELAALDGPDPGDEAYLWEPVYDVNQRLVFTPDQRGVIRRDHMGPSAVAEKMGLPHPTQVGEWMEQQGLRQRESKARNVTLTDAQREMARAALGEGVTIREIAAKLGLQPNLCSMVLDREGLRPRLRYKTKNRS